MSEEYPYNGRLSRWEEIADGLAIVGVQALEDPFPFEAGQYATLGLMGPEGAKMIESMIVRASGTGRPTDAARAGHSVAVLLQIYAKCLAGQENTARRRIEAALNF